MPHSTASMIAAPFWRRRVFRYGPAVSGAASPAVRSLPFRFADARITITGVSGLPAVVLFMGQAPQPKS
ncbi:hypothetical protein [Streptomyces anandii]|uniref:hypothetical protein n=1 Tax=Streptomyces anandii TaxID=285454 RepID=UPI001672A23B|nr:hypothetical protein [Streptomyces anandii]GGX79148.1 hypothetical protein GCM10010510_25120 [Streptomyces anandii JCM 4720]